MPRLRAAFFRLLPAGEGQKRRSIALGVLALAATVLCAAVFNGSYAIKDWLFWTLATIWAWQLVLAAACLSAGHALLVRVAKVEGATPLETVALAAPLGVLAFALGMFVAGFLGLYGVVFAVIWPLALFAAGLPAARPAVRAFVEARRQQPWPRPNALERAVIVFGILGLAMIYLGDVSPEAINYDASWSHLTVSQDCAREGGIIPIWADWPENLPHLGSIINVWSFIVPGLAAPQAKWMMAMHTELALFLWTLVAVAAAVRFLTERPLRGAWVAMFLFPAIFVYDSNLGGAGDHVLAFFAVPVFLAAVNGARTLDPRWWALFGVFAGGGLLAKYQAAYLCLPPAILLAAAWVRGVWRQARRRADAPAMRQIVRAPLAALAGFVVLTAPQLGQNWLFYRNPVYPFAQDLFTASRPTFPGAPLLVSNIISHWGTRPPADFVTHVKRSFELFFTFSFQPHANFSGPSPYFGSLFTLSLPLALFVPRGRRIRLGVAMAAGALATWCWTYWVDRNLQTFTPLLAAATAAVLVRAWETGRAARIGVAALVALQVVWGGDLMFSGDERLHAAIALIKSGVDGHAGTRYASYRKRFVDLSDALPKNARVLLHGSHVHLGLDRRVLLDWLGFQGLIDYRKLKTPYDLYNYLRGLGITHVVWESNIHPVGTKQEEVLFAAFITRLPANRRSFEGLHLLPLDGPPPPLEQPYRVLQVGVDGYPDGLYDIADLATWERMPPDLQIHYHPRLPYSRDRAEVLLGSAQAVVLGPRTTLDGAAGSDLGRNFERVVTVSDFTLSVRR